MNLSCKVKVSDWHMQTDEICPSHLKLWLDLGIIGASNPLLPSPLQPNPTLDTNAEQKGSGLQFYSLWCGQHSHSCRLRSHLCGQR